MAAVEFNYYADPKVLEFRETVARETLQTLLASTAVVESLFDNGKIPDALINMSFGIAEAMVRRSFGLPPEKATP